jgi:hypothetical protein
MMETADQLAREGPSHPITGPQPAPGIYAKVARGVIMDWTHRKHEHWQSIHRQRQGKAFFKKPSVKKAGELLGLSRNQLIIMTGLLTGHCHLKGHLF